jgi:hypothetical protein
LNNYLVKLGFEKNIIFRINETILQNKCAEYGKNNIKAGVRTVVFQ